MTRGAAEPGKKTRTPPGGVDGRTGAAQGAQTAGRGRTAQAGASAQRAGLAEQLGETAAVWSPLAGRVALALVLAWFGYHELVRPSLWTGYVPLVSPSSSVAIVAVLAHGWVLLMLAVALAAGIASRAASLAAAAVMLEIVVSLTVTAGLSDLTLRDVGVLGLAVALTGIRQPRMVLRR